MKEKETEDPGSKNRKTLAWEGKGEGHGREQNTNSLLLILKLKYATLNEAFLGAKYARLVNRRLQLFVACQSLFTPYATTAKKA